MAYKGFAKLLLSFKSEVAAATSVMLVPRRTQYLIIFLL